MIIVPSNVGGAAPWSIKTAIQFPVQNNVDGSIGGLTFNAAGTRMYVSLYNQNRLAVVDTSNNNILAYASTSPYSADMVTGQSFYGPTIFQQTAAGYEGNYLRGISIPDDSGSYTVRNSPAYSAPTGYGNNLGYFRSGRCLVYKGSYGIAAMSYGPSGLDKKGSLYLFTSSITSTLSNYADLPLIPYGVDFYFDPNIGFASSRVYIAGGGADDGNAKVQVCNPSRFGFGDFNVATVTLPAATYGNYALSAVLHPDNSKVYIGCQKGSIAVLSRANNSVIETIYIPNAASAYGIYGLEITPDGKTLFAHDGAAGKLWVIDTATSSSLYGIDIFPSDARGYYLKMSNDGKTLYAYNSDTASTIGISGWVNRGIQVIQQ